MRKNKKVKIKKVIKKKKCEGLGWIAIAPDPNPLIFLIIGWFVKHARGQGVNLGYPQPLSSFSKAININLWYALNAILCG